MEKSKDKYRGWYPIENIENELFLYGIYNNREGFRILLEGDRKTSEMLRISFDTILFYRVIQESYFLRSMDAMHSTSTGKEKHFYIVDNSSLVIWFNKENYTTYKDEQITHYAIFTYISCADILCPYGTGIKAEWL